MFHVEHCDGGVPRGTFIGLGLGDLSSFHRDPTIAIKFSDIVSVLDHFGAVASLLQPLIISRLPTTHYMTMGHVRCSN